MTNIRKDVQNYSLPHNQQFSLIGQRALAIVVEFTPDVNTRETYTAALKDKFSKIMNPQDRTASAKKTINFLNSEIGTLKNELADNANKIKALDASIKNKEQSIKNEQELLGAIPSDAQISADTFFASLTNPNATFEAITAANAKRKGHSETIQRWNTDIKELKQQLEILKKKEAVIQYVNNLKIEVLTAGIAYCNGVIRNKGEITGAIAKIVTSKNANANLNAGRRNMYSQPPAKNPTAPVNPEIPAESEPEREIPDPLYAEFKQKLKRKGLSQIGDTPDNRKVWSGKSGNWEIRYMLDGDGELTKMMRRTGSDDAFNVTGIIKNDALAQTYFSAPHKEAASPAEEYIAVDENGQALDSGYQTGMFQAKEESPDADEEMGEEDAGAVSYATGAEDKGKEQEEVPLEMAAPTQKPSPQKSSAPPVVRDECRAIMAANEGDKIKLMNETVLEVQRSVTLNNSDMIITVLAKPKAGKAYNIKYKIDVNSREDGSVFTKTYYEPDGRKINEETIFYNGTMS